MNFQDRLHPATRRSLKWRHFPGAAHNKYDAKPGDVLPGAADSQSATFCNTESHCDSQTNLINGFRPGVKPLLLKEGDSNDFRKNKLGFFGLIRELHRFLYI